MKAKLTQHVLFAAAIGLFGGLLGSGALSGCSTAEVVPLPAPPALPPPYVQVPHPVGYDLGDLRAIFTDRTALRDEDLKTCDADFKKLKGMTQSLDEIALGARELVRHDPVRYHWCFYGQILRLENEMKGEGFLHERQRKVIETYSFVAPIGKAFMQEFHDSRYMRWAVRHYRQVSEWVFYRRLDMTPQATSELVEASNPFGLLREPAAAKPVLEKYGIVEKPVVPAPIPVAPAAADVPPPVENIPAPAAEAPANAAPSTDSAAIDALMKGAIPEPAAK